MSILRISTLAAVLLLPGACAGSGLQQAEQMSPNGSEFERHLHANYVDLSHGEFQEEDYRDSDDFAQRAMAAATGSAPEPERLSRRDLPRDKRKELAEARTALMAAFTNGARETSPVEAARAQAQFDCWMQEQEENFQHDEIAACRDAFYATLAALNSPPEPVATQLKTRGEARVYGINFDFDSATLRTEATPVLQEIRAALESSPGMKLRIEGHTDALGTNDYNAGLSLRRARSVVGWLVMNGIAAERLEAMGMGESIPVADNGTAAGRAENRRVELKSSLNQQALSGRGSRTASSAQTN